MQINRNNWSDNRKVKTLQAAQQVRRLLVKRGTSNIDCWRHGIVCCVSPLVCVEFILICGRTVNDKLMATYC
jgi:hypothetical protein